MVFLQIDGFSGIVSSYNKNRVQILRLSLALIILKSAKNVRNEKGLVVYGAHCTVVVVDVLRIKIIQTFDRHTSAITHICCSSEEEVGFSAEVRLRCASADVGGTVVVWDIVEGVELSSFSIPNSTALSLAWFPWEDTSRDFLLVLHSPNNLVLWNIVTGDRIWNVTYSQTLSSFSVDPFDPRSITFGLVDIGSIMFVDNVLLHKAPLGKGTSLSVFNATSSAVRILQVEYHNAFPNILFATTESEIACIELECRYVIWRYVCEVPLLRLMTCSERDIIVTVHSNGIIEWRACKMVEDEKGKTTLNYEFLYSGETQRQTHHCRISSVALCPVTQTTVAFLYNSGNISIYQLGLKEDNVVLPYRASYITDITSVDEDLCCFANGHLKMSNIAQLFSLGQGVTTVRIQPLYVEENSKTKQLTAVGSNQGIVRLVEISTGTIFRELHIHTCPIKCIDWCGPHKLISAAYVHSLSASSLVKNDIFVTDIRTGEARRLRPEVEETPVEMLRVSFYYCYVAIGFRNEPLEIWHLKSMRLLRRMSRSCPVIVDMAWSGKHHAAKRISQGDEPVFRENLVVLDEECHLYHVVVKGLHVRDGKEVNSQWKSGAAVKCLVWKDDLLAMGDAWGRIGVWDLGQRQCHQTRGSSRGPVLKLVFSRTAGDHTLAVLHQHTVVLWDSEQLTILQQYSSISTSVSFLDIDLHGTCLLAVCSDNSFRCIPLVPSEIRHHSDLPLLLETDSSQLLKTVLGDDSNIILLRGLLELNEKNPSYGSSLQWYLLVHRLFGERWLYDLWSVVISALHDTPLSSRLQIFWSPAHLKRRTEKLVACLMSLPDLNSAQVDILVHLAVVLQKLLLGSHEECRTSALRACLLASDVTSEGAQSIIKLVATNLIANECMTGDEFYFVLDRFADGVQMLFLIGHGDDACRYLQAHGFWSKSFHFAKLGFDDWKDVGNKWVEHLTTSKSQKNLCGLLAANIGDWNRLSAFLTQNSKTSVARHLLEVVEARSVFVAYRPPAESTEKIKEITPQTANVQYSQS
uniref:Ribosome control protein 1 domain-containing protein n=1 Tax=Setaria digitata TaxID=48799 RepID=A0A915PSD2_9BILA